MKKFDVDVKLKGEFGGHVYCNKSDVEAMLLATSYNPEKYDVSIQNTRSGKEIWHN